MENKGACKNLTCKFEGKKAYLVDYAVLAHATN
jgi:hypothetical protein